MKITPTLSMVTLHDGEYVSLSRGVEAEVPDAVGKKLIAAGHAEDAKSEQKAAPKPRQSKRVAGAPENKSA